MAFLRDLEEDIRRRVSGYRELAKQVPQTLRSKAQQAEITAVQKGYLRPRAVRRDPALLRKELSEQKTFKPTAEARTLSTIGKTLDIPSAYVSGVLRSPKLRDPTTPVKDLVGAGLSGVKKRFAGDTAFTAFETVPKQLGLKGGPALAVGLAAEVGIPDPFDLRLLGKAGKAGDVAKAVDADKLSDLFKNALKFDPKGAALKPDRLRGKGFSFKEAVTGLAETGKDVPGRIRFAVNDAGEAVIEDGRHLLEAYRRMGKEIPMNKIDLESLREVSTRTAARVKGPAMRSAEDLQLAIQRSARKSPEKISSLAKSIPERPAPRITPNEAKSIERAVDKKVNILDWFRTPDRVLEKIGLGKEAELLKTKYNDYLDDLPQEIGKISQWYERVKDIPDSNVRIFKYLDGQDMSLTPRELEVAGEIKLYLKDWANKLGLPEDKRVANYITRLFEDDFIQKEFDPELAKIIADKIPGSVYDPFLQKRMGALGYKEDVWKALDAYVKRGTRKFHMDQALGPLKDAGEKIDLDSWNYVKELADRVNLRPTRLDNYIDNFVKQTRIGYKLGQRPTARVSRGLRQATYRGTLGLNLKSAVKNLTQGVNTYAQLGERYTAVGYMRTLRELASKGDELTKAGVLRDTFIQDRSISSVKKFIQSLDEGLWVFFDATEKINRGAAYFGAKAKALSKGASEEDAIKAGIEMARKTQFTFGSVDTPVALQADMTKLLTQFQSFNVKQTEFLAEMIKNRQLGGLFRWTAANLFIIGLVGEALGYDIRDAIPFSRVLAGESKLGRTPALQAVGGVVRTIAGGKGGPQQVVRTIPAFIPGGIQMSKIYRKATEDRPLIKPTQMKAVPKPSSKIKKTRIKK